MQRDKRPRILPADSNAIVPLRKLTTEIETHQSSQLEKVDWHPWNLPEVIKWLGAALGYLMGVVGFIALFFPSIGTFRVLTLVLVLSIPILLVAGYYAAGLINLARKRLRQYSALHILISSQDAELEQLNEKLSETETLLLGLGSHLLASRIEIERVRLSRGKVFLIIDIQSAQLQKGDQILLIDTADGKTFGLFEITEIERTRYTAQIVANLDAVWAGDLHQMASSESHPPPGSAAILYRKGQETDEQ
ncbi:MAG TPA: hypothetical protein DC047_02985 [Blastocatellia bacterium]|nr:hypothetical protein [Blastocatellia bacterium]